MRLQVESVAQDLWSGYLGEQTMNLVIAVSEAESGAPVVGLTEQHISVIAIAGAFDGVEASWQDDGGPDASLDAWEPWPTAVFENSAAAPGIYRLHVWHRSRRAATGIWAVVVSRGADRGTALSAERSAAARSST